MNILKINCPICQRNQTLSESELMSFAQKNQITFAITNNPIINLECLEGHSFNVYITNNKFEILYQLGIKAYMFSYNREAVVNFASCYERFHEFIIFSLNTNSIEDYKNYLKVYKNLSTNSEREYGAFTTIFYDRFKILPKKIDSYKKSEFEFDADNAIHFRNKVVHQGFIPTARDTYNFAILIATYIHETLNIMISANSDRVAHLNGLLRKYNLEGFEIPLSYFTYGTLVNTDNDYMNDGSAIPFNELIISPSKLPHNIT